MGFKVGDIIKGKKDNGYSFTNEKMTRAEVLDVSGCAEMRIKVLKHADTSHVGLIARVLNTTEKFEFANQKLAKEELFAMPVGTKITTDAERDNEYFYTGLAFESKDYRLKPYEINEDLTLNVRYESRGTRIVKIEEPEYTTIYEEKQEKLEMTLAEIEKQLGHPVKIVKEEQK